MSKCVKYNELDNKLTIGSWKLTALGTLLVEVLFLLGVLALIGIAGGIETGAIDFPF